MCGPRWPQCAPRWEWRLLRPLLQLVALLSLLTAVALVGVVLRVESTGAARLDAELRNGLAGLERLRQAVQSAPDSAALQQLLASQPGLLEALDVGLPAGEESAQASDGGTATANSTSLADRQRQAFQLLVRAEASLVSQATRRRADASGNLTRQALRLGLSALVYALFHLAASLLWPRSLLATRESILEARAIRRAEEAAAEEEQSAELT